MRVTFFKIKVKRTGKLLFKCVGTDDKVVECNGKQYLIKNVRMGIAIYERGKYWLSSNECIESWLPIPNHLAEDFEFCEFLLDLV